MLLNEWRTSTTVCDGGGGTHGIFGNGGSHGGASTPGGGEGNLGLATGASGKHDRGAGNVSACLYGSVAGADVTNASAHLGTGAIAGASGGAETPGIAT